MNEEYSELTGPNSYIYGLFVLGYSIQGYRNRVTNSNYAMCVLKYGGSWILADLNTLQITPFQPLLNFNLLMLN